MENPSFFLEGVVHEKNELQDFEGPLSLILMLLQKNKIEIRDIKIADILDQYLAYLEQMQQMDLEIASEFVQMASHLLYIKTKTLLTDDEKEVSELELLMASLEQLKSKDVYESVKQITPGLKSASELGLLYYSRRPEPLPKEGRVYEYRHEPADLLHALLSVYSRGVKTKEQDFQVSAIPSRIVYSVRDKSRQILERLRSSACTLQNLYMACASRSEVVATFLSVLELCSMGSIKLVRSADDYSVEFAGGDVDEILEKIEE
ncbi:MAG: segregation/condensation protein A [Oscillospiraceae bacterium]|nr:segregation/condensation protein A [Oscillospiraceae bacterium]